MALPRSESGSVEYKLIINRNGEDLTNSDGGKDLNEFVTAIEVFESITSATLEARVVINDSAGLIGSLTGSEIFKLQINGSISNFTYYLRSYNIESRSRVSQSTDVYIVSMASEEYIKNEITNVFGNTTVLFNNDTRADNILKLLLRSNRFLGTNKRVFTEDTLNAHDYIIPNWRPFDCIYWMCNRSIRAGNSSKSLQSGYVFFENAFGYHYKSIDKMIDDVNSQSPSRKTNYNTGEPRLYRYEYIPKRTSENQSADQFKIDSIVFPEERNFLMGLRHGAWSGFSIGLDPVTISSSKMGASTDLSADAYRYSIFELWSKMSHLQGGQNKNPLESMDKGIQEMIKYPKRVRYSIMPNQIFDQKDTDTIGATYEQLVELQAYQWMRIEALKTLKLQISVPGNLDLYAGHGIEITIPSTAKSGNKTKIDKKYSGRYIIAGLTHKILGNNMTTELLLLKDSIRQ